MSSTPPDSESSLDDLRRRIDDLDERLVEVLNERARVVVEIGKAKRTGGTPIYAPHREREVLERAIKASEAAGGPLSARTIEAIYRELMSGSFALELPLRVGYLGPAGSFSHVAAVRHFGSSVEYDDLHQIEHVFEEVAAGRCNYGLVPYENSIGGGVTDTLDAFQSHEVTVYAEALIEVSQTLLANCLPSAITTIYSKPQAFDQCRKWLAKHYPDARLVPVESTAAAVKRVAEDAAPLISGSAAIGSTLAGELYNVKPIFEHIQDKPNNITRFLVIAHPSQTARPTGDDKTTIMFVAAHRPGSLVDVLAVFRDAPSGGINLSHIDKRPSGKTNWEYTFFIDCDRHIEDPVMSAAIDEARSHCVSMRVLGSYPRAPRIL